MLLAGLYSSRNQFDKARRLYEECIAMDKEDTEAYLLLGSVVIAQKKYREAAAIYEKVLAYDEDNLMALYYAGRLQGELKNYDKARSYYEKLLSLKPNFELALLDIATLSEMEGKLDAAVDYYKRAIQVNPASKKARARIAAIYVQKKDYDKAISEFEKLSDLDREDLSIRENIGLLHLEKGRYEQAIQEFSLILASRPKDNKARLYLAMALQEKGDLKRATEEFLKVDPKTDEFHSASRSLLALFVKDGHRRRGHDAGRGADREDRQERPSLPAEGGPSRREIGVCGTASRSWRLQGRWSRQNVDLLYQLAMLYEKNGDNATAMRYMEDILKTEPDNAGALNFIGYSFAEKGINLDRAEELIKKALEKRPDDGYIMTASAGSFTTRKTTRRPWRRCLRPRTLVSDDGVIAEHLSDVYVKLGQYDKAIEFLRHSIGLEKKQDRKKALEEKLKGLEQQKRK